MSDQYSDNFLLQKLPLFFSMFFRVNYTTSCTTQRSLPAKPINSSGGAEVNSSWHSKFTSTVDDWPKHITTAYHNCVSQLRSLLRITCEACTTPGGGKRQWFLALYLLFLWCLFWNVSACQIVLFSSFLKPYSLSSRGFLNEHHSFLLTVGVSILHGDFMSCVVFTGGKVRLHQAFVVMVKGRCLCCLCLFLARIEEFFQLLCSKGNCFRRLDKQW